MLRAVGFVAAVVLGIISIWLIVTSDSTKNLRIGALCGFWGLLVGGFSVFGRHLQQPAGSASAAGELALRGRGAVERPEDARARLDFEMRLVQLLRREVQETMSGEIAKLSADVQALRTEFVDKVGGELRLERVETTRVFGSDIEALQAEINQLKRARVIDPDEPGGVTLHQVVDSPEVLDEATAGPRPPKPIEPAGTQTEPVPVVRRVPAPAKAEAEAKAKAEREQAEAAAAEARAKAEREKAEQAQREQSEKERLEKERLERKTQQLLAEKERAEKEKAQKERLERKQAEREKAERERAERDLAEQKAEREKAEKAERERRDLEPAVDVFADLPRLSRFTDFDLDDEPSEPSAPESEESGGGGRRRRDSEDDDNSVLAQILARARQESR